MTIWGSYQGNPAERIDSCSRREVDYMLREYRLAFGQGWILWAGKKSEKPESSTIGKCLQCGTVVSKDMRRTQ